MLILLFMKQEAVGLYLIIQSYNMNNQCLSSIGNIS